MGGINRNRGYGMFQDFWKLYPRKVSRMMAEKAWNKLSTNDQESALSTLPAHCSYWLACETEKQFIPHAATWINQHRFEDEIELPQPKKQPEVAWWGSEQQIIAKGQEVGVVARPGESIHQLKGRIVDKLRAA